MISRNQSLHLDLKTLVHPSALAAVEPSGVRARRILVAEDHPVNQLIAQKLLERLGFEVDVAGNGLEALTAIDRQRYDLVLMDCQMPMLDGYEATRRIRRHPGGHSLPVVALTAHDLAGDRAKCLAAGMNDYLAKPMDTETLSAVLARWL